VPRMCHRNVRGVGCLEILCEKNYIVTGVYFDVRILEPQEYMVCMPMHHIRCRMVSSCCMNSVSSNNNGSTGVCAMIVNTFRMIICSLHGSDNGY